MQHWSFIPAAGLVTACPARTGEQPGPGGRI